MKHYFFLLLLGLMAICSPNKASAAMSDWVKEDEVSVRLVAESPELMGLQFHIADGWKTYWRTPGDGGVPVILDWEGSNNIENITIQWPAPKRFVEYDVIQSFGYKHDIVLPLKVKLQDASNPANVKLHIKYAVCSDLCIYFDHRLALDVPVAAKDAESENIIMPFLAQVPQQNNAEGLTIENAIIKTQDKENGVIEVRATAENGFQESDLLIEGGDVFRYTTPKIKLSSDKKSATFLSPFEIKAPDKSPADQPLTLTLVNYGTEIRAVEHQVQLEPYQASPSLIPILLIAILGGLILNIMPCVLPVLSLKFFGLMQHGGKDRHHIRKSLLATSAGIIVSFLVLAGIVIALRAGGMAVGWGFHFQQPLFLVFLVIVLTLFTANMFGFFEVILPGRLNTTSTSDFWTGAFATLLATPCSAPFVGTAIGFAFSQGPLQILLIFFFMGIGLSLPYLVGAVFPSVIARLPRPGMWMVRVKYILGLLLLGTALWLIFVFSNQWGMQAATYLGIIALLLLLALWFKRYRLVAVTIAAIAAFVVPGFFINKEHATTQQNTEWQVFNEAAIPALVAEGKTVFVDVTADWCLTCKANEKLVLSRPNVKAAIFAPNVVAMRADFTNPDPGITQFLNRYKRYGIPFNIVFSPAKPEGVALPEVLSEAIVLDALNAK